MKVLSYVSLFLSTRDRPVPIVAEPSTRTRALRGFKRVPASLCAKEMGVSVPLLSVSRCSVAVPVGVGCFKNKVGMVRRSKPVNLK